MTLSWETVQGGRAVVSSWEYGIKHYSEGRFLKALKVFETLGEDGFYGSEQAYYMGLCHSRLGNKEKAMELLLKATQDRDNFARMYQSKMLLSWLNVEQGSMEKAKYHLQEILNRGFESPQAWAALGYCQWFLKETELAIESYRNALKLDSENANASNSLGYILADSDINPEESVVLCRKALKQSPDNSSYQDSLGWALFKSGQTAKALAYLTEALEECPEDKVIKEHLEVVRTHGLPD